MSAPGPVCDLWPPTVTSTSVAGVVAEQLERMRQTFIILEESAHRFSAEEKQSQKVKTARDVTPVSGAPDPTDL